MPAVITPLLSVISNADSSTGWTGGSPDTEIVREGVSSIGAKVSNGVTNFDYTGAPLTTGINLSGTHIFLWVNCTTATALSTKAAGGCRSP